MLYFRSARILSLLFPLLLLALPSSVLSQETEKDDISVDSSIVVLNVVITDGTGAVKKGFGKSDFVLLEDGVEQKVEFIEPETTPFAAVILLDVSGSMEQRVSIARAAAIRFLEGIRADDQVSIFSFHRKVELVQDFSNTRNLRSRVFDLKASGYTALNDAVYKAASVLKPRSEIRKAIIVLSDGEDTRSGVSADKALKAAQDADATIYAVDMSILAPSQKRRTQNQAVLKKFASKTGGVFIKTPGGRQLREAFADIVGELGIQYTIGYSSTNEKKDGKWRQIELKPVDKTIEVRTREGYYASMQ